MAKKKLKNYTWLIVAAIVVLAVIVMSSGEGGALAKYYAAAKVMPVPVAACNGTLDVKTLTGFGGYGYLIMADGLYSCQGKTVCFADKKYNRSDESCGETCKVFSGTAGAAGRGCYTAADCTPGLKGTLWALIDLNGDGDSVDAGEYDSVKINC